ncbi:hypothetical protein BTUL_0069g00120 [Botrytis tulipae]|uniref:NAD(P)-binding domain-containing protein n=1 Tax=Botrytis tulipae TaxID=87230 RepID=A0A4Z1EM99_9HELO|nr:hypothetical protein BTUL_0069g00120 [Botrytis tulipae]
MAPIIVLISGANRGLGTVLSLFTYSLSSFQSFPNSNPMEQIRRKGLLAQYISKPDHIVIAANRDPSHPTPKTLPELPTGANSKLVVIKIDGSSHTSAQTAIHWLTKRMNVENPPLNAFVLDPGWCQTELGNAGAVYFGMDQAAVSVEDSCALMVPLITKSTKESHGGKLWSYEGGQLEW